MNQKYIPQITKDILDEYFDKMLQVKKLKEELSEMSTKIKYEMNKADRVRIDEYGYKINLETKFEPTEDFFELMYKKELDHLITPTITSNNLKSAKRKLNMTEAEYLDKYAKEKSTKWLYVTK